MIPRARGRRFLVVGLSGRQAGQMFRMSDAPEPGNEVERLESLRNMQILDTVAEERFDRLTRMAQRHFKVPYALVSLVSKDRQWHKSASGDLAGVPRELSFCAHNILSAGAMVILDATLDPRFSDNELVEGTRHFRFYAGVPLLSSDGFPVGAFCVIDDEPREFNEEDLSSLIDFAACAETELQLRKMSEASYELLAEMDDLVRRASVDPLTSAWNRSSIMSLLDKELERARRKGDPLGVMMLDVDHFKHVNDTYGHPVGDVVLREVASRIRRQFRFYDSCGRYGGEEFLILVPGCDLAAASALAERVLESLRADVFEADTLELQVTASLGVAVFTGHGAETASDLLRCADEALYRAKHAGRNQVQLAS
jgi:diguanylate cyclase (GGDEF)-like protein